MEIFHRLTIDRALGERLFARCGVTFSGPTAEEIVFEISEEDPRWPYVAKTLDEYRVLMPAADPSANDHVWTVFTEEERRSAQYLVVSAGDYGYPQPQELVEFRRQTWSGGCATCRSGASQIAPLRLKRPPIWERREAFQLNWVPGEILLKASIYEAVLRPFGVAMRPVVSHKNDAVLECTVQLSVEREVAIDITGLSFQTCELCGTRNYTSIGRGYEVPPSLTDAPIFRSEQRLDGFQQHVYVSQALYQTIAAVNVKGLGFRPCRSGAGSSLRSTRPDARDTSPPV